MQGAKRRIVYVSLYEGIAVCVASVGLLAFSKEGFAQSIPLSIACSTVAVVWNLVYNWLFERWEATRAVKGRSVARRVAHAIGFEGGLAAVLLPLMAWWLDISLWEALIADVGLLLFFLVYTFVFNWAFDRIFGLPASAATAKSGAVA